MNEYRQKYFIERSSFMQKPLKDMARYIQNILPMDIPGTYMPKAMYDSVSDKESIRSGVLAFRDFLYLFCDCLAADGHGDDIPPKNPKNEVLDHTSLAVDYPFLNNVKSVLINIGYHGELTENGTSILLGSWQTLASSISADGGQFKSKISVPKIVECLRFLTYCGFEFKGIDLGMGRPDMSNVTSLKITYPDNPAMLTGLKVMAIAQKEPRTNRNDDIFLRCDYRVLEDVEADVTSQLKDFIRLLPDEVRDFALKLHKHYLDAGLTCKVRVFYLSFRFTYSLKNKEIWAFSASLNYGYRILIKAENTHQYADVIKYFPLSLQEIITAGYGCDKKKYGRPCQGGCHGFRIPLDDSILDIRRDIEIWLDNELGCLRSVKR